MFGNLTFVDLVPVSSFLSLASCDLQTNYSSNKNVNNRRVVVFHSTLSFDIIFFVPEAMPFAFKILHSSISLRTIKAFIYVTF